MQTPRVDKPAAYPAEGVLCLTSNACFGHLLRLPGEADVGKVVDIQEHHAQLAGVQPHLSSTLPKELPHMASEIPTTTLGDASRRSPRGTDV